MKLGNGNKAIMKRLSGRSNPFKQFCGDSDIKPDLLGGCVCSLEITDCRCCLCDDWHLTEGTQSWVSLLAARPGPALDLGK